MSMKDEAFLSPSFRRKCAQEVTAHCKGRKTKWVPFEFPSVWNDDCLSRASVIQCLADEMLKDVLQRSNTLTEECRDELKFELLQRVCSSIFRWIVIEKGNVLLDWKHQFRSFVSASLSRWYSYNLQGSYTWQCRGNQLDPLLTRHHLFSSRFSIVWKKIETKSRENVTLVWKVVNDSILFFRKMISVSCRNVRPSFKYAFDKYFNDKPSFFVEILCERTKTKYSRLSTTKCRSKYHATQLSSNSLPTFNGSQ